MAGWDAIERIVEREIVQLVEEGVQPEAANEALSKARRLIAEHADEREVWAVFQNLPRQKGYSFVEPNDLKAIRGDRIDGVRQFHFNPTDELLYDKMYGAWLGRCVGCALGKPVEWFMGPHNGLQSWQRQKRYLTAISSAEWPLKDYFPQSSPAEAETGKVGCKPSTREHISFMETDDDIRYTVLGQILLRDIGPEFCSAHVASNWFEYLPYNQVCTAETQAYRNMVIAGDGLRGRPSLQRAVELDRSVDWSWIANHLNPYREWIGAQIRIDSYGYAAAGNPELAAEFAWRDARISHVKNGIYGAMLCSAMIAAAFATDEPRQIVEAGLAEIPRKSRLYCEMRQIIAICEKHGNDFAQFESVIQEIYSLLGHYDAVHTNNNAALCVAAVLLSGGDFHKGITFAVMGGLDTDCNGATVGSIVGAVCGATRIPRHWTGRLNDTLKSFIIDYHPISISECARMGVEITRRVQRSR